MITRAQDWTIYLRRIQFTSSHTISFWTILLIFHLHICLPIGFFLSGFLIKILCEFSSTMCATYAYGLCHNSGSCWIPTMTVQIQSRPGGICGQSGTGAGYLWVHWFPLTVLIPPTYSHSFITQDWHKRPNSGWCMNYINHHAHFILLYLLIPVICGGKYIFWSSLLSKKYRADQTVGRSHFLIKLMLVSYVSPIDSELLTTVQ